MFSRAAGRGGEMCLESGGGAFFLLDCIPIEDILKYWHEDL